MIKFRFYYYKDEEMKWLNEMVNKGWAMKNFFLFCYTFERCKPGEYIYQVDLMEYWTRGHEDYKEFMSENGIEVVCQWFRWITLRKKSEDGAFELYTDKESMIEQYQRIYRMFRGGLIIEVICFIMEFFAAVKSQKITFVMCAVLILLIMCCFIKMVCKSKCKIEELKRR